MRHASPTVSSISAEEKERLMQEYKPFILRTACAALRRYVSDSDDAWSVALIAFGEALDHYNPQKGDFNAYAALVIRRRLADEQRRQRRFHTEIDVAPEVFTGALDPESPGTSMGRLVLESLADKGESGLREEIADASRQFAWYGFSFADLVDCSPKAGKTRKACADAALFVLGSPALAEKMRGTRKLPVYAIATGAHVPLKLLDRHRRYIIAVVEILSGDYPGLAAYLSGIRREVGV